MNQGNGCSTPAVAATVFPIADIAQNLAGGRVKVITVLPPGASPHAFEPKPDQVKALAQVQGLIMVGGGLDDWAQSLLTSATTNAPLLNLYQKTTEERSPTGQPLPPGASPHNAPPNPHLWLDPILVRDGLAPAIAAFLAQVDPQGQETFQKNLGAYQAQLTQLDQKVTCTLGPLKQRHFIQMHGAWDGFALRYGLAVLGTMEEHPGQEISAKEMTAIVGRAKQQKANVGIPVPVIAEPQTNSQVAQALATEVGGHVYTLDPLGGPQLEGRNSYLALMDYNLAMWVRALQGQ